MNREAFNEFRDRDEQVIWAGKPAFFFYALSGVHHLIAAAAWFSIAFAGLGFATDIPIRNDIELYLSWAFKFMVSAPLPYFLFNFLRRVVGYKNVCYGVTNKRFIHRTGFPKPTYRTLKLDEVERIVAFEDPVTKLLGFGHFIIGKKMQIGNKDKAILHLLCISEPKKVLGFFRGVSGQAKVEGNLAA